MSHYNPTFRAGDRVRLHKDYGPDDVSSAQRERIGTVLQAGGGSYRGDLPASVGGSYTTDSSGRLFLEDDQVLVEWSDPEVLSMRHLEVLPRA